MSFIGKFFSLCIDVYHTYHSAKTESTKANEILETILDTNKDVCIDDFLKMYNMRMYNINTKQNDIKFMKNIDFEGVYILRNSTLSKCLVGKSSKVFKKIIRHFTGYGNMDVFCEWKNGNTFYVNVIMLKNSGYTNIDQLEFDTKVKYNAYDY